MLSCDLEAGLPEVAKALANCNRCRWLKNRLGWQKRCVFTLRDGSTTSWLAANPRGEAFGLYCTVCRKHCPGSLAALLSRRSVISSNFSSSDPMYFSAEAEPKGHPSDL